MENLFLETKTRKVKPLRRRNLPAPFIIDGSFKDGGKEGFTKFEAVNIYLNSFVILRRSRWFRYEYRMMHR